MDFVFVLSSHTQWSIGCASSLCVCVFSELFNTILNYPYMCLSGYGYVYVSAGAQRGQKRVLGSLDLNLQEVISHLTWVLGTEFGPLQKLYAMLLLSHLSALLFV